MRLSMIWRIMQIKGGVILQGRRPKKRPAEKKKTVRGRDHSFLICNIGRKILFPSSMKFFCGKRKNNGVIMFQYSF